MSFYPEFRQHPSQPHQCIHVDADGNRCGSHAMRNQYTCYHHRSEDMPSVFPNEAFPIDSVQDRAAIQIAIGDVLARLAANTMDPKRASSLLYGLQLASSNLPPHPRPARGCPIHDGPIVMGGVAAAPTQPATDNLQPATLPNLRAAAATHPSNLEPRTPNPEPGIQSSKPPPTPSRTANGPPTPNTERK